MCLFERNMKKNQYTKSISKVAKIRKGIGGNEMGADISQKRNCRLGGREMEI